MIAQQHRFHGHNSLKAAYAHGQNFRNGPLNLKYSKRPTSRPRRIGVVVSKKVHKSAVVRNRIRRRIYEIIRTKIDVIEPGSDLIFTAYDAQIASMEATKLQNLVNDLLQKATQN